MKTVQLKGANPKPMTIGELYWVVDNREWSSIHAFLVMLVEYNDKGKPVYFGKDGFEHYSHVYKDKAIVDECVENNKKAYRDWKYLLRP